MSVDRTLATESSVLAFGRCGGESVVLKIVRGSEERSFGEVLERFDGLGTVRVYAHAPCAGLLERLRPATPLVTLCDRGEDRSATSILADVIGIMDTAEARADGFPGLAEWGASFRSYLTSGDKRIPKELVEEAADRYATLSATQNRVRLLHGDLHHHNVLLDSERGWLAVDPKGVVGELEYELGAALRNPCEAPDRFAAPKVLERRIRDFEAELPIDADRVRGWAYSQAVLAALWGIGDGIVPGTASPFLRFATSLRQMLE